MTSEPPNQAFLFVNKGLASQKLSRSESKEHSRMLSHVRSRNVNSKRPWQQHTNVFNLTGDNNVKNKNISTQSLACSEPSPAKSNIIYDAHDTKVHTDTTWLKSLKHDENVYAYLSSSWPSVAEESSISFRAGCADITIPHRLLRKSREHLRPPKRFDTGSDNSAPQSSVLSSPHRRDTISEQAQARDGDELLLYSSIAHSSSAQAWRNGHVGDNHSQFWIGKTLRTLRSRLTRQDTSPDTGVILSIFMLAMAALSDATPRIWADNPYTMDAAQFSTCRTHLQAMLTLVEKAGGWQNFDPYILEGMLLVDKYAALHDLSHPLIPLTAFDPREQQVEFPASRVPSQDAIPDITTAFDDIDIDPGLKHILRDIGRFYHAAGGIWKPAVKLTPQQESLVYRRFQALHYRLLLVHTTDPSSELVRLATLVVMCNATLYGAGLVFTRVTSSHLATRMARVLASRSQVHRGIWCWCLCTGATTRLPCDAKAWFVDSFLQLIGEGELGSTVASIRIVVQRYLYVPWLQDAELEAVLKRGRSLHDE